MSQNQNNKSEDSVEDEKQSKEENIRKINFQDSDDDDQSNDREILIETFMEIELKQCRFQLLEKLIKQKVLEFFPKQFHSFVNQSYIIHNSPISTVLLGERKNIQSLKNVDQTQNKYKAPQQTQNNIQQLIVLKSIKHPSNSMQQILQINSINFFKYNKKDRNYLITMQRFEGINLSSIISYFSNTNIIKLKVIQHLLQQLICKVEELRDKKIIHGDINPGNIVVRVEGRQEKQWSVQQRNVQQIFKHQLQNIVNILYGFAEQSLQVNLSIIDNSNSWVTSTPSPIHRKQESPQPPLPTQTINYRSPQALYSRGSYPIDIWGIGLILFTLLTGQYIYNSQFSWNENQLEQIFKNQKQFYSHIDSLLQVRQQSVTQEESRLYRKLTTLLMKCLLVDVQKRPSIQQLLQMFHSKD